MVKTGKELYDRVSFESAELLTRRYSTSFGLAVRLVGTEIRPHIYNIYGFVRVGDEIVDTFHGPQAKRYLDTYITHTKQALRDGFSANPVLHAFSQTAQAYNIEYDLIAAFFESMKSDLPSAPTLSYEQYIYGSAEVVGLMCLHVFCQGDKQLYRRLTPAARALGAAFQKINFFRDLAADTHELKRNYFPGVTQQNFDERAKQKIIQDINRDIARAQRGIDQLPASSRYGVVLATRYFAALTDKLSRVSADRLKSERIRLSNFARLRIVLSVYIAKLLSS